MDLGKVVFSGVGFLGYSFEGFLRVGPISPPLYPRLLATVKGAALSIRCFCHYSTTKTMDPAAHELIL